ETGQWGTPQSGVDSNLNGDNAGDRTIFNAGGVPGTGSDVYALCNSSLPAGNFCNGDPDPNFAADPYIVAYAPGTVTGPGTVVPNSTAQYVVAGPGALATTGRGILKTNPINNLDLTVAKHIAATERFKIELFAGWFNAFNHAQFTTGSVNQASSISDVTQ